MAQPLAPALAGAASPPRTLPRPRGLLLPGGRAQAGQESRPRGKPQPRSRFTHRSSFSLGRLVGGNGRELAGPSRARWEPGPQAETLLPRCAATLGKQSHGGASLFFSRCWSPAAPTHAGALDTRPASWCCGGPGMPASSRLRAPWWGSGPARGAPAPCRHQHSSSLPKQVPGLFQAVLFPGLENSLPDAKADTWEGTACRVSVSSSPCPGLVENLLPKMHLSPGSHG